jgi:hypothetical protein
MNAREEKKDMNIFKLLTNQNHSEANQWIGTMIVRENKKDGGQEIIVPQISQGVALQSVTPTLKEHHVPQIICTVESFKTNEEEKQKIRQVHDELEGIPFTPTFAF